MPKQATFTCNDGSTTTLLTPSTVIDAPSFTTTQPFNEAVLNVGLTDKLNVSLYHTTHHKSTTDYDYDADKA